MKFYHKYKRNEVPHYFVFFNLHTQGSSHDYNYHQRDDIRTSRTRIKLTEKYIHNYSPKTIYYATWQTVVKNNIDVICSKTHICSIIMTWCQDTETLLLAVCAANNQLLTKWWSHRWCEMQWHTYMYDVNIWHRSNIYHYAYPVQHYSGMKLTLMEVYQYEMKGYIF